MFTDQAEYELQCKLSVESEQDKTKVTKHVICNNCVTKAVLMFDKNIQ